MVRPGVARAYVDRSGFQGGSVRPRPHRVPGSRAASRSRSWSTPPAASDRRSTSRQRSDAAVDAVLESMGPKDSVIVLAAVQNVVVVGPRRALVRDPELRAKDPPGPLRGALRRLERIGMALSAPPTSSTPSADPKPGNPGMVVYIGDGRPTGSGRPVAAPTTPRSRRARLPSPSRALGQPGRRSLDARGDGAGRRPRVRTCSGSAGRGARCLPRSWRTRSRLPSATSRSCSRRHRRPRLPA